MTKYAKSMPNIKQASSIPVGFHNVSEPHGDPEPEWPDAAALHRDPICSSLIWVPAQFRNHQGSRSVLQYWKQEFETSTVLFALQHSVMLVNGVFCGQLTPQRGVLFVAKPEGRSSSQTLLGLHSCVLSGYKVSFEFTTQSLKMASRSALPRCAEIESCSDCCSSDTSIALDPNPVARLRCKVDAKAKSFRYERDFTVD